MESGSLKTSKDIITQGRVRRHGGGRKCLTTKEENLLKALDDLVEPTSRGDPMSPLRWTAKPHAIWSQS